MLFTLRKCVASRSQTELAEQVAATGHCSVCARAFTRNLIYDSLHVILNAGGAGGGAGGGGALHMRASGPRANAAGPGPRSVENPTSV